MMALVYDSVIAHHKCTNLLQLVRDLQTGIIMFRQISTVLLDIESDKSD